MKQVIASLLVVMGVLAMITQVTSCANIIPPSGGPRDSLPPRLVAAIPKDSAVNVNTKNITLTFDEYITLQNPLQNLIVSPNPSGTKSPLVDYKLRNVTIKLKDTLEPNTTYSFNFGEAIRDVNESNIARNLIYVFSTGNKIDYNTYSGKVLVDEKGKPDSTLLVVLHNNLSDTAINKLSPRYYTRINGKGEFIFHNLPEGRFNVYVVPNNFLKRYEDSTLLFAFKNTPVIIGHVTPMDTLYAFEAVKKAPGPTLATGVKPPVGLKEDKRLKYIVELDNGQQDLLSGLTLTFNRKLMVWDTTKILLYDTTYRKISGYSVSLDTGKTKLSIQYNWKESQGFRLLLPKEAVADSAGANLPKTDTVRFITKREADYGSIRLRFSNLDLSRNPVLQFVQGDKLVESVPLTQPEFVRKKYRPGAYELRILYDTNKNGVWDTGTFAGIKRQPEIVFLIPKQLAIRANWDNEVTISL